MPIKTAGGAGASTSASYVVVTAEAGLSAERVLTAGAGISVTDGGANTTVTVANTKPATKEFFIPATQGTGTLTNIGDFPAHLLSGTVAQSARMVFEVPADFTSITTASIVFVPAGTSSGFTITTDYGAIGQAYNTHSEAIAAGVAITVANILTAIALNAALTSLAAGDFVGVTITTRGNVLDTNIYILGVYIKYA